MYETHKITFKKTAVCTIAPQLNIYLRLHFSTGSPFMFSNKIVFYSFMRPYYQRIKIYEYPQKIDMTLTTLCYGIKVFANKATL